MNLEEVKVGHARLLYKERPISGFSFWFDELAQVDRYVEGHQRLNRASDMCHLYFFSEQPHGEDSFWCAREVVGFEGHLPQGLGLYDLYAGVALTVPVRDLWQERDDFSSLLEKAKEARRLASAAHLAQTWRLSLSWSNDCRKIWPEMSFQFFKIP